MATGRVAPPKDNDTVEQARQHKLQLASDIIYGLGLFIVYLASAILCALAPVFLFPSDVMGWVVMLAIAGGCLSYGVHRLMRVLPLNSSVHVSNIGIVSRGWRQADTFIHWADIIGVAWIGKRQWDGGPKPRSWLYSLFLEVSELSYGCSRIKLGSSHWAGPIGEVRDKIVEHCGLQEVDELRREPVFFWHSTKRQIWRRSAGQSGPS